MRMTTFRRGLPLLLAACLLIIALNHVFAQDGATDSMTLDDQIALFDYDATADLMLTENGSEQRSTVTIKDIAFTPIPGAEPVLAYLVVPDGEGPFAGILWVH